MKSRYAILLAVALSACAVFSLENYMTPIQEQQLIDTLKRIASSLESFVQYVQGASAHFKIPPPLTQHKK